MQETIRALFFFGLVFYILGAVVTAIFLEESRSWSNNLTRDARIISIILITLIWPPIVTVMLLVRLPRFFKRLARALLEIGSVIFYGTVDLFSAIPWHRRRAKPEPQVPVAREVRR